MVEARVSDALARVFSVTLDAAQTAAGVAYLAPVDQELRSERSDGQQPLLSKETLERVLFSRLSEPPSASAGSESPFRYLVGCYRRASDEGRRLTARDGEYGEKLQEALGFGRDLVVSYSGMLLNPNLEGMFPQPEEAKRRGALQLLDVLETPPDGMPPLAPPGFLEHLVTRFENEGLEDIMNPTLGALPLKVQNMSPLGPFQAPLMLLKTFATIPATAKLMTAHPKWRSKPSTGRAAMVNTILGPFFNISTLPDMFGSGLPPVHDVLRPDARRHEVEASMQMMRGYLVQLQSELATILLTLRRRQDPVPAAGALSHGVRLSARGLRG